MIRNRVAKFVFLILIVGPLAIFVFGFVVMWLWNNVASPVLNLGTITFWQGLGLLVLARILFGSFGSSNKESYREKRKRKLMWEQMTPEQREKFKEEWRIRCQNSGRGYWRDQRQENVQSGESQV